jgi:hypothetical protein
MRTHARSTITISGISAGQLVNVRRDRSSHENPPATAGKLRSEVRKDGGFRLGQSNLVWG